MERRRKNRPYQLMLAVYLLFFLFALIIDSPEEISRGIFAIVTCRSVLITDYFAIGGIGATLVNSALVGIFSIFLLMRVNIRPNGSTIMAMWLTTGFAMMGKNVFNMIPITLGVWLYTVVKREPMKNYTLQLLLAATLSPVVSGLVFHPSFPLHIGLPVGILAGVMAGFLFPAVSSFAVRVHGGYNLYNMGFTGGLISTFICSGLASIGIPLENELHWYHGADLPMALLLYIISAGLMLYGLFASGRFKAPPYGKIMQASGRLVTDFLVSHGYAAYFNMGLMGAFATTLVLVTGADLNGATMCGVFNMIGFAAFGKHLKNVAPVVAGALICTWVNQWDPTSPANSLAILFSAGLAPIAGQFGPLVGILTGFLHVNTVMHIGFLNSGLNLYNNGYAAGFVALLLVPIIMAFQREKKRGIPEL